MVCVCALHGGVTVFVVVIAVRRRRSFFGYFLGVALVSFVGQNCVLIMPVLFSFCLHPQPSFKNWKSVGHLRSVFHARLSHFIGTAISLSLRI